MLGEDDSVNAHVRETQEGGAGLVNEHAARVHSLHRAAARAWLVKQGVAFSDDRLGPLGLHLTREGGLGVRRIAPAADATGKAIHDALPPRTRTSRCANMLVQWT